MTIKEFANKFTVRVKVDDEQEHYVPAKHGQIYQYSSDLLGAMFLTRSIRLWNTRREECVAAGLRIQLDGDTEGLLLFDPADEKQARTAIRTIGARVKRRLNPEARQAAIERLARLRNQPPSETTSESNFELEGTAV